jgi:hypothetical protein
MTEEEICEIVRDEIAEYMGGEGGLLDEVREHAFNMARAVLTAQAEFTLKSFDAPKEAGAEEPEGEVH